MAREVHELPGELQEHPAVRFIQGVDSDTDGFVVGPTRELWNAEALARADAKRDQFFERVGDHLRTASQEIVALLEDYQATDHRTSEPPSSV